MTVLERALLRDAVTIDLLAVCHDCRREHAVHADPTTWLDRLGEWEYKHRGHRIEFRSPRRVIHRPPDRWLYRFLDRWKTLPWWMGLAYAPNADIKLAYVASSDWTITLASLASSADWTVGRESTVQNNTTDQYLEYIIGGKITTGTTPTASRTIKVWAHGSWEDTPLYFDTITGADAGVTITSADILAQLALMAVMATNGTSNRTYFMAAKALSLAFGGILPKRFGLYVAHDTGVNLNSTGSNHKLSKSGVYVTG